MKIPPDARVERHLFFNSSLQELVCEDPDDKGYADYSYYLQKNIPSEQITQENAEQFVPFLEVVILSDPLGICSFMVSFLSLDELDKKRWRRIRATIQEALDKFELDKTGSKGHLFFPRENETPESPKGIEKLCNAYKVQLLYKEALEDVKNMLAAKAELPDIAACFGMPVNDVKMALYGSSSGRPTPSELVMDWLWTKKSELLDELGINSIEALQFEILNRKFGRYFPKMKKLSITKRRLLPTKIEKDVEKED